MDFFNVVSLLGGLALFLYGMNILATGLEKVSGGRLEKILEKMTNNLFKSVFFGAVVTAAVQSSSATTVIVVGLVNAKILKLRQAIGVIMGANIGTTVTAHILRLSDISADTFLLKLLKPTTLAPLVAVVGILLFMTGKKTKIRSIGQLLLGFGILFTGMFNMEAAVRGLKDIPEFANLFSAFQNPVLGVLVGAVVTAIIQSSSASVGILQALCSTGSISYAAAFPIIMGQNIGTCITPILASIGASKNAKRSAAVHLTFNILGTAIFLAGIYTIQGIWGFPFWNSPIDKGGIANFHTIFNVTVTLLFLPFTGLLEKLSRMLVKDKPGDIVSDDVGADLDERLLTSPGLAIQHSSKSVLQMGILAESNYYESLKQIKTYDNKAVERIGEVENTIDRLESKLEEYLLLLSQRELDDEESRNVSLLLHVLSEFERVGDYSENIVECAQRLYENNIHYSEEAQKELDLTSDAVGEIIHMAVTAFEKNDLRLCTQIEPLEEVIDFMVETLKTRHIQRLQAGKCTVDAAFPFVETLSNLERISDHCSNVAVYIVGHSVGDDQFDRHAYLRNLHSSDSGDFTATYAHYEEKYKNKIIVS